MPIHLIWGDDAAARDRAIQGLIDSVVDPSWSDVRGVVVLDRSELRAQKYEVMYLDE